MLRDCVRLSVVCDVWTDFNSLAYHIPASSVDYQKNSFFYRTDRDWICLPDDTVRTVFPEQFRGYVSLRTVSEVLRYSTGCGERGSRPFREEPETFISILISTTPMHLEPFVMHSALPARPQPLVIQESSTCWSLTASRRKKERLCIVAKRCCPRAKVI